MMAANAEITLANILSKLTQIADKLGEKTTAQARQEENLKKYNERRVNSAPDATTKIREQIADDVADVAKTARRHWIPTLDGNESKRIENIAKVYGKTLKLSDNFTAINQLLKAISTTKTTPKTGMKMPVFDVEKISNTSIKGQYVKLSDAINSILDIKWLSKNAENIRKTNWLKKFQHISTLINDRFSNLFQGADWNWFETSVENRRRFSWEKQFEPIKKFFSISDKFSNFNIFKNVDWNWFDKNVDARRNFMSMEYMSRTFLTFKKNIQDKMLKWVTSSFKLPEFPKSFASQFDATKITDGTSRIGGNVRGYMSVMSTEVSRLCDHTKKIIKDSKFSREISTYKKCLIEFKSSVSTFLFNIASQISTVVEGLKKNAGDFVVKLEKDEIQKYNSVKEGVSKMLPTFKKQDIKDDSSKAVDKKKSFTEKFKNSAVGIAALGVGVSLLIGSMIKCGLIDAKAVGVFAGVVTILGAAVWGLSSKADDISKGAKAIGILGAAFGLIVLSLKGLINVRWDDVSGGLLSAGVALTGLAALAIGLGKFATNNVMAAAAGGAALVGLTMVIGMLGENLGKFSNYDWKSIDANLGMAAVAVIGFGALAGIIGTLMVSSGGLGALAVGGGILAIAALAKVMGYTGEQLQAFTGIDGNHLKQVGDGMMAMGAGMAAFFAAMGITGAVGVVGGIVQGMAKWFDLDLVSQLKKYDQIDASRVDVLGKSLSSLANGLRDFTSTSNSTNQLTGSLSELKNLEKLDIKKISNNLDSIAAKLSNIKSITTDIGDPSTKFKFELTGISEMSEAITQMGQQEVDLLQQQLAVLADSRELLMAIRQNTSGGVGSMTASASSGSSLNFIKESSVTRQSFFNNLKMMSTTLKD